MKVNNVEVILLEFQQHILKSRGGFGNRFFEDGLKMLVVGFNVDGLPKNVVMEFCTCKNDICHFFFNLSPFYFIFSKGLRRVGSWLIIL